MMFAALVELVKELKALQQKRLRQFGSVPAPWATLPFPRKGNIIILDLIKVQQMEQPRGEPREV